MKLHRIIVHELKKISGESKASLDLSSELIPQNGISLDMLTELDRRFSTLSLTYAMFDMNPKNNFPILFDEFHLNRTNETFVDFSTNSIKILEDTIKVKFTATGGFVIFAEYENKYNYLAVFLVRNKKSKILHKKQGSSTFDLTETLTIDVENLAMAGRINIDNFINKEASYRYITFVNKRNEDSEYFLKWFSIIDKHSNKEDTKIFREIINNIDLPRDENGEVTCNREEFVNNVLNLIKQSPNRIVNLRTMGETLFNNSEALIAYAEENNKILNHEFKPHPDEIRKLFTVKANAEKIFLNFPLNYLKNGRVYLDSNLGTIVIQSKALVEKIQSEKISLDEITNG